MSEDFSKILAEECGGDPSDYRIESVPSEEEVIESRTDDIDMSKDDLPVKFEDIDLESAESLN